jgi:hypothetical protein
MGSLLLTHPQQTSHDLAQRHNRTGQKWTLVGKTPITIGAAQPRIAKSELAVFFGQAGRYPHGEWRRRGTLQAWADCEHVR